LGLCRISFVVTRFNRSVMDTDTHYLLGGMNCPHLSIPLQNIPALSQTWRHSNPVPTAAVAHRHMTLGAMGSMTLGIISTFQ
jgi:hypothetical protein